MSDRSAVRGWWLAIGWSLSCFRGWVFSCRCTIRRFLIRRLLVGYFRLIICFRSTIWWLFVWCCGWTISCCAFALWWPFVQIRRLFVFFFYWFTVWWRRRVIGCLRCFIRWSRGTVWWCGLIIRWSWFLFWFFVGWFRSSVRQLLYWLFICRFWCAIWRSSVQVVVRWSVWSWNFITIWCWVNKFSTMLII